MRKVKVSEASGKVLDWMVAQAEGLKTEVWHTGAITVLYPDTPRFVPFFPSRDWAHGGPIIAWEKIQLTPLNQDNPKYGWAAAYKNCNERGDDLFSLHRQRGLTPLVAAMRAYVASKLGEEVEVPEELL